MGRPQPVYDCKRYPSLTESGTGPVPYCQWQIRRSRDGLRYRHGRLLVLGRDLRRQAADDRSCPGPPADSTSMSPPWSSITLLTSESPSPTPTARPSGSRPRKNILEDVGADRRLAIPMPLSATSKMNARRRRARADRVIRPPASVNLMALPTRLNRACLSRRSSPSIIADVGRAFDSERQLLLARPFARQVVDLTASTTLVSTRPMLSTTRPASIDASSRMSLISASRRFARPRGCPRCTPSGGPSAARNIRC